MHRPESADLGGVHGAISLPQSFSVMQVYFPCICKPTRLGGGGGSRSYHICTDNREHEVRRSRLKVFHRRVERRRPLQRPDRQAARQGGGRKLAAKGGQASRIRASPGPEFEPVTSSRSIGKASSESSMTLGVPCLPSWRIVS
jgi:hypothetical protein